MSLPEIHPKVLSSFLDSCVGCCAVSFYFPPSVVLCGELSVGEMEMKAPMSRPGHPSFYHYHSPDSLASRGGYRHTRVQSVERGAGGGSGRQVEHSRQLSHASTETCNQTEMKSEIDIQKGSIDYSFVWTFVPPAWSGLLPGCHPPSRQLCPL